MPCIGNVPSIVASGSIASEANPSGPGTIIPSTTIYTPTAAGIFRVSVYVAGVASGNPSSFENLYLTWTDENGSQQLQAGENLDGNSGFSSGSSLGGLQAFDLIVHAEADAMQVSADHGSGAGTYTLYYVVEQLA